MIDVLSLLAKGEIEENTTLIVSNGFKEFEYKYRKIYRTFVDEDLCKFDGRFNIDENFLNQEVSLEQPKVYKYRIKLPNTKIYVGLGYDIDGTYGIYTYTKNSINEVKVDYLRCQFREKDFEKIEELKPYEQFKELVKDDENE